MSSNVQRLRDHDTNPCLAHAIMIQRRRDGVKPNMPTADERENILKSIGGTPY